METTHPTTQVHPPTHTVRNPDTGVVARENEARRLVLFRVWQAWLAGNQQGISEALVGLPDELERARTVCSCPCHA